MDGVPPLTWALRSRPPVLPPKMGEGVLGSSLGGVQGAGSSAAGALACNGRGGNTQNFREAELAGQGLLLSPLRQYDALKSKRVRPKRRRNPGKRPISP